MKIPDKPIKNLSTEEQLTFLASCRNHTEKSVALTLIFNKERVYTSEEIASMLKEKKMTPKDNFENAVEVTFLKK